MIRFVYNSISIVIVRAFSAPFGNLLRMAGTRIWGRGRPYGVGRENRSKPSAISKADVTGSASPVQAGSDEITAPILNLQHFVVNF